MQIQTIIDHIQSHTPWVDYRKTRDFILIDGGGSEVSQVAVCWVATMKVIEECIRQDIHFIISHENCLYVETTAPYKTMKDLRDQKIKLCQKHQITIYRCHDGWDQFPVYGVADSLARSTGIPFDERPVSSFYHYATIEKETVSELAEKLAKALKPHGCGYVEILGDPDQRVTKLGMGVGAAMNSQIMMLENVDCMILADDGFTNWIDLQWCLDAKVPCILCHHSTNEMEGMAGMVHYLSKVFPDCRFVKLDEGFQFTLVEAPTED